MYPFIIFLFNSVVNDIVIQKSFIHWAYDGLRVHIEYRFIPREESSFKMKVINDWCYVYCDLLWCLKTKHFTIQPTQNVHFSQCLLLNLKSWRWTMDTRCTCEVLTSNQSKTNGRTSVHTLGNFLSIPQYLKDWMCTHDSKA